MLTPTVLQYAANDAHGSIPLGELQLPLIVRVLAWDAQRAGSSPQWGLTLIHYVEIPTSAADKKTPYKLVLEAQSEGMRDEWVRAITRACTVLAEKRIASRAEKEATEQKTAINGVAASGAAVTDD